MDFSWLWPVIILGLVVAVGWLYDAVCGLRYSVMMLEGRVKDLQAAERAREKAARE